MIDVHADILHKLSRFCINFTDFFGSSSVELLRCLRVDVCCDTVLQKKLRKSFT